MRTSGKAGESAIHRFLRWWLRELSWFVPRGLGNHGLSSSRLLWLANMDAHSKQAVFYGVQRGSLREIGRIDLRPEDALAEKIAVDKFLSGRGRVRLGVAVKPTEVLNKTLTLPVLARGNLEDVVRFELDRQTPYPVDQVYLHQAAPKFVNNKLLLDLAVLPRHVVDPALARVRAWGMELHGLAVGEDLRGGQYVNFLPKTLRPPTGRIWPWLYGGMALITLVLLAFILASPVLEKRSQAMALVPELSKAEQEAKAVSHLKEALAARMTEHNHLIEKRLTTPPVVLILDELTRLMPDNTWVQSFELRGEELVISGETSASSRLVGLFDRARWLGEANHRSPLVKLHNNQERFQLAIAIKKPTVAETLELATTGARRTGSASGVAR